MRKRQRTNEIEFDTHQSAMTGPPNSHAQTALQYLTWALEEIEKAGNEKAAHHARNALEALRRGIPPINLKS
jgi:hypothetical protein